MTSFIRTNFRRAVSFGSVYLILAIVMSILVGGIFSWTASLSEDASLYVASQFPMMIPLFAVIGSFGGLMVFVSDRTKGVYEYLIAYGVSVYKIFWATLLVTLGLVTIFLGISLAGNMAILLLMGSQIQFSLIKLILIYTIPLCYASTAFMCIAGMMWSSLTVRVPGVNSPIGISALIGMLPVMVVYFLTLFGGLGGLSTSIWIIIGGVVLLLVILVIVMMIIANNKMNRERLLSDA
ncbi:MAG: hypothetical protein LBB87_02575 [Nitrososphaerota archaeon]|nr:hypothetical protein [Nitrososphaerota archaeon]